MTLSKTFGRTVLYVAAALLLVGMILKLAVAPWLVHRWLVRGVSEGCETCRLTIGRLRTTLFPTGIDLTGVHFVGGTPGETVVDARADRLTVPIALIPLLRKQVRLGYVRIDRPQVHVVEGDTKKPPEKAPPPGAKKHIPDFEIRSVVVRRGEFSYTHEKHGKRGILRCHEIDAEIGRWGGSPALLDDPARGRARGRLEDSGRFGLSLVALVFAAKPHVDVDLELEGQNLADVNRFFRPDEGILLKGSLIRGHGEVAVRGGTLTASVAATYKNLDLSVEPTKERSPMAAFLLGIASSMKLEGKNLAVPEAKRNRTTALQREPDETLIAFILRGLKEAALKVAAGPYR